LGCLALAAPSYFTAQTPAAPAKGDRLKLVVVVSRHGVRSPTWTEARLNTYSAKPWPMWPVAPGELTQHGYELLKVFGGYDRAVLSEEGLLSGTGCVDAASTYLWADTDQRTLASGHALADGLFPGCGLEVHSLAEGQNDPLFHPTAGPIPAAQADAAFGEFQQRFSGVRAGATDPLLRSLQNLLDGCAAEGACTPQRQPKSTLFDAPSAAARGKGDHIADVTGPLPLASTFSEDLLLEYAEGMPTADVGWGEVDEAQVRRLIALHTRYFDLMHRTRALATLESSPMLREIARTLQQAVEGRHVEGALGVPEDKLVFLVGHDTNLTGIAGLLDVHWTLDGRPDDTSPGTELVFELWQSPKGEYAVRTLLRQQTLRQMRELQPLSRAHPPGEVVLQPRGCAAAGCSWTTFLRVTEEKTPLR
jgi:4-phytase/acid phosphatase